jgi:pyruvate/2-oxoglutarate/acetoin dehydrogenase E1 component
VRELTYREAIREALQEEMRRDPSIFILGEDVAGYGGAFKVTAGLLDEFGPKRVMDTPISESAIVGVAVGAALMGMRPVAELMFADFLGVAMDAVVNHAAKVCYLSGGESCAPLVVRMAYGAGLHKGAHHSQSAEAWVGNVPGLTIVMPSTPADANGLLRAALRLSNPVLFFEHSLLYNKRGPVPDGEHIVPIGKAEIRREGRDLTIVASGRMSDLAMQASASLQEKGIDAEVIDPRSIVPLDETVILDSVRRTGRLLVVHEAPVQGGFGAEVAARVGEKAFGFLDAPIRRVGAPWTPVPFSPPLEALYLPSAGNIVDAACALLGSSIEEQAG